MLDIISYLSLSTAFSVVVGSIRGIVILRRKKVFYKIAKYIETKIFKLPKNKVSIKALAEQLKEAFSQKTIRELWKFATDLLELEKELSKENVDKFFEENKERILASTQSLQDYFTKRNQIKEFSLFVFNTLYSVKIDTDTFDEFQDGLIEDFVLNLNITPKELQENLDQIYHVVNLVVVSKFDQIKLQFIQNKETLMNQIKTIETHNKKQTRTITFLLDSISGLHLSKELIEGSYDKIFLGSELGTESTSVESELKSKQGQSSGTSSVVDANSSVILENVVTRMNSLVETIDHKRELMIAPKQPLRL